MKRLLLIPALMLLSTAVNAGPAAYLPRMVSVSIIETTVPEVSGLCLAPAGDGMLAASDEDGLYHVAWDGTTTPFYIEEDMDCEGVTIDPATRDVYYVVEWAQEVRRLRAPDYDTSELLGVITEAGLGTNDGLEGITWYKDGVLLVGNQRKPVRMFTYSPSGEILDRRDLTGTREIADLCYDPVRDVLWIADSIQRTLNLCTPEGRVRASWSVSFIDNGESIYVDHEHGCLWVGDDTTSRIYKIQFEGL